MADLVQLVVEQAVKSAADAAANPAFGAAPATNWRDYVLSTPGLMAGGALSGALAGRYVAAPLLAKLTGFDADRLRTTGTLAGGLLGLLPGLEAGMVRKKLHGSFFNPPGNWTPESSQRHLQYALGAGPRPTFYDRYIRKDYSPETASTPLPSLVGPGAVKESAQRSSVVPELQRQWSAQMTTPEGRTVGRAGYSAPQPIHPAMPKPTPNLFAQPAKPVPPAPQPAAKPAPKAWTASITMPDGTKRTWGSNQQKTASDPTVYDESLWNPSFPVAESLEAIETNPAIPPFQKVRMKQLVATSGREQGVGLSGLASPGALMAALPRVVGNALPSAAGAWAVSELLGAPQGLKKTLVGGALLYGALRGFMDKSSKAQLESTASPYAVRAFAAAMNGPGGVQHEIPLKDSDWDDDQKRTLSSMEEQAPKKEKYLRSKRPPWVRRTAR